MHLLARQPGGGHADDDGVVAGEDDVDEDDLKERRQRICIEFEHLYAAGESGRRPEPAGR